MFRVEELFFIEREHAWAVALVSDIPGKQLTLGMTLVSGMRRWQVTELHAAPAGLLGARLDGPDPITRGLFMRSADEGMGNSEYQASAVFLVRIARACRRTVDLEGVIAYVKARRETGTISEVEARAVAKTAVLVRHLVDHGASAEELDAAATALNLKDEV